MLLLRTHRDVHGSNRRLALVCTNKKHTQKRHHFRHLSSGFTPLKDPFSHHSTVRCEHVFLFIFASSINLQCSNTSISPFCCSQEYAQYHCPDLHFTANYAGLGEHDGKRHAHGSSANFAKPHGHKRESLQQWWS